MTLTVLPVFQSTPSAWRETDILNPKVYNNTFQSTPSAWRETDRMLGFAEPTLDFNPLPPHGGRLFHCHRYYHPQYFNPLPPHGGRPPLSSELFEQSKFQSTPSAWRETTTPIYTYHVQTISIHSLRMEGDTFSIILLFPAFVFQSTPSAWRETAKLHRKAFFISPILVQSCKKGCKRLHSAPEKMVFFEKREKNLVRNLQHLSVRL